MENVRKWLSEYAPLPDKAWAALSRALRPLQLDKNEAFQTAHKPADRIGFLTSGALYALYADEGRKHRVAYFNLPEVNRIVCDLQAFTENGRATMDIKAVAPCELLVLERKALYHLYDKHPSIERLGRRLAEYSYARAIARIGSMQKSKQARLADLRCEQPDVIRIFPQKLVAEYLGMNKDEASRQLTRLNGHSRSDAKTRSRRERNE